MELPLKSIRNQLEVSKTSVVTIVSFDDKDEMKVAVINGTELRSLFKEYDALVLHLENLNYSRMENSSG